MRLLACSDIHNNVEAVQALRLQEPNQFEAILIAGDIGSESAAEILDIFDSFNCPVFFVYGNWDNRLAYFSLNDKMRHQVHLNLFEVNGLYITGFSGCPTSWGKNPEVQALLAENDCAYATILKSPGRLKTNSSPEQKMAYQAARKAVEKETLKINRQKLAEILTTIPNKAAPTLVITHERLTRLNEIGTPLIHIHGHLHRDSHSLHQGTHILNVACLDRGTSPFSSTLKQTSAKGCGYSVITLERNNTVLVERRF